MSTSIEIDFQLLDEDIKKMKKLKDKLKKPEISCKYDIITNQNIGKGDTSSAIFDSSQLAQDYYRAALALIENTVKYLESIKALEQKDKEIAKGIQQGD